MQSGNISIIPLSWMPICVQKVRAIHALVCAISMVKEAYKLIG